MHMCMSVCVHVCVCVYEYVCMCILNVPTDGIYK